MERTAYTEASLIEKRRSAAEQIESFCPKLNPSNSIPEIVRDHPEAQCQQVR